MKAIRVNLNLVAELTEYLQSIAKSPLVAAVMIISVHCVDFLSDYFLSQPATSLSFLNFFC